MAQAEEKKWKKLRRMVFQKGYLANGYEFLVFGNPILLVSWFIVALLIA